MLLELVWVLFWPKNSKMGHYSLLLMVAEHYNKIRRNMELLSWKLWGLYEQ